MYPPCKIRLFMKLRKDQRNGQLLGESIYRNQNAFVVIGIVKESGNADEPKIYVPERTIMGYS